MRKLKKKGEEAARKKDGSVLVLTLRPQRRLASRPRVLKLAHHLIKLSRCGFPPVGQAHELAKTPLEPIFSLQGTPGCGILPNRIDDQLCGSQVAIQVRGRKEQSVGTV